jgi:glycosyltransferase involved in cell wall biosynthesis
MNKLSIIIPTLNEQDYIPLLLHSIVAQRFKGQFEVIVVDGQSSDKTIEVVGEFDGQFDNLKVISSKPNIGHQRNIGAATAHYPYLLFLDADVILANGCLNKLASKVRHQEQFIAAVLHVSQNMNIADYVVLGVIYFLFFISWLAGTPVTNGDFILTTKTQHDRINGFKEGAILGEDTDYGLRSVKAGAKYHFYFSAHIIASDRRISQMGRWKLLKIWSKAFLRARKTGPTYMGVEYQFGHYQDGIKKPQKQGRHHVA